MASPGWFKTGPRSSFRSEEPGFGVLRVSKDQLRVRFYDADGVAIYGWGTTR